MPSEIVLVVCLEILPYIFNLKLTLQHYNPLYKQCKDFIKHCLPIYMLLLSTILVFFFSKEIINVYTKDINIILCRQCLLRFKYFFTNLFAHLPYTSDLILGDDFPSWNICLEDSLQKTVSICTYLYMPVFHFILER